MPELRRKPLECLEATQAEFVERSACLAQVLCANRRFLRQLLRQEQANPSAVELELQ